MMSLLGSFGGFNFTIIMIPSFLLSFYTPKFYESSIASEMPIKRKARSKTATPARRYSNSTHLTQSDVKKMYSEAEAQMGKQSTSSWRILCCQCSYFTCGK